MKIRLISKTAFNKLHKQCKQQQDTLAS